MGRWSGRLISLTVTEVRAKSPYTSVILGCTALNFSADYESTGKKPLYFRNFWARGIQFLC